MMSGKLFARILKTDFKQRAWSLLLGFIVFFLCLQIGRASCRERV